MNRRQRSSWIGLDIEPSLQEKRRAALASSRIPGVLMLVVWAIMTVTALWHCSGGTAP